MTPNFEQFAYENIHKSGVRAVAVAAAAAGVVTLPTAAAAAAAAAAADAADDDGDEEDPAGDGDDDPAATQIPWAATRRRRKDGDQPPSRPVFIAFRWPPGAMGLHSSTSRLNVTRYRDTIGLCVDLVSIHGSG